MSRGVGEQWRLEGSYVFFSSFADRALFRPPRMGPGSWEVSPPPSLRFSLPKAHGVWRMSGRGPRLAPPRRGSGIAPCRSTAWRAMAKLFRGDPSGRPRYNFLGILTEMGPFLILTYPPEGGGWGIRKRETPTCDKNDGEATGPPPGTFSKPGLRHTAFLGRALGSSYIAS